MPVTIKTDEAALWRMVDHLPFRYAAECDDMPYGEAPRWCYYMAALAEIISRYPHVQAVWHTNQRLFSLMSLLESHCAGSGMVQSFGYGVLSSLTTAERFLQQCLAPLPPEITRCAGAVASMKDIDQFLPATPAAVRPELFWFNANECQYPAYRLRGNHRLQRTRSAVAWLKRSSTSARSWIFVPQEEKYFANAEGDLCRHISKIKWVIISATAYSLPACRKNNATVFFAISTV